MPVESKVEPAPYPDHPNRCQATCKAHNSSGQCPNLAVIESKFCAAHGGLTGQQGREGKNVSIYRIAKFQQRYEEMMAFGSEDNPVLGLRNEIGVMRMKLEAILEQCDGPADLMIHSQTINMTIQLLAKLVVDAKKLESSLGQLLDRTTVIALCDNIVRIVAAEIDDPKKLEVIGRKISDALELSVMQRVASEGQLLNEKGG